VAWYKMERLDRLDRKDSHPHSDSHVYNVPILVSFLSLVSCKQDTTTKLHIKTETFKYHIII